MIRDYNPREFALDDREFELFVEGARRIGDDRRRVEGLFVAFVGGRLGLRPGEPCHMQESWIDWRRRYISIPYHEPYKKGKDGGSVATVRSRNPRSFSS